MKLLVLFISAVSAAHFPNELQTCESKSPDFLECLRTTTTEAINFFIDGYAPLKIPSLNPLVIPEIFVPGTGGAVATDQKYKDFKVFGIPGLTIDNFKIDLDEFSLEFRTFSKQLSFIADYELDGKVLVLPIQGKGVSNVTLINVHVIHALKGEKIQRRGKTYLNILDYTIKILPERIYFDFQNLFNGNKVLGDEINKLLNENWPEIFKEMADGYEDAIGIVLKSISNLVFKVIPYHELFRGTI